ncbi:MAG: prepilin-type N-terminal cleavage/methylation domain-containing protein [Gammaproteobacteria bacterium]|nr:prepilin-type N-terminal cleavage/methylation domain-containing protein [Gammaproteobacteria bacterium]
MQYSKQKGFTLVEIAIVLVIVGLLIGGVLKGQEMITNAKLKRIESDNAGIAAAMFSYQDRYLQLPGDDSGAADRFTVYAAADPVDGDGSGTVDGVWDITSTGDITAAQTAETNMFFAHLRAAGLIPGGGVDDTKPTNAYGGQIGVMDGALNMSGHVTIFGAIEGPIAKIIEARLDDNDGDTGRVQSAESGDDMTLPASASAVYDDAERYDMAFRL